MNLTRLSSHLYLLLSATCLTLSVSAAAVSKADTTMDPLDCVINPSVVADLGSGVPGILSRVQVDRSDFVRAGDVVAELESGVETAALELARARAALTAEVDLRKVNAAFGQRQNQRTKDLFQRKAISTNDMDQRQTEASLAHIQLRQARDNQELAELEMLRAQEILKRRTIKSPIDGVVMERFKVIGEYVEDQPVVRVAQIDPLHVEVIVPVERLGMIRNGMHAKVWSETVEGDSWQATVSRVDQVADVASGTYGVRLTMPNPDHKIPAGLRCRMQLVDAPPTPVKEATAEIADAVRGNTVAAAAKDKTTESRPVEDNAVVPKKAQPDYRAGARDAVKAENKKDVVTVGIPTKAPEIAGRSLRPLPAGVKPIRRETVGAVAAVEPQPDAAEVSAAAKKPRELEEVVEQAAAEAKVDAVVAELDPDQLAADLIDDDEETDEVETVEVLPACRLAGPYSDEVTATRKVVALRRAGLYVDIKSVPLSKAPGYMIATPVLRNRAEAKALVKKLEAAGITDFYLPRKSSKPLRISLGLYNGTKIAKRQIENLAKKGFEAELLPWEQRGARHYLVIRGAPAGAHRKLLASLPAPDDDSDIAQGFCNQLAIR